MSENDLDKAFQETPKAPFKFSEGNILDELYDYVAEDYESKSR
jgi:hypothetical protein